MVWAIQHPYFACDDSATKQLRLEVVRKSLNEGISRFGWSECGDLRDYDDLGRSESERTCFKQSRFLLNVKTGDWLVHINLPRWGTCIAARVTKPYEFDRKGCILNDFEHLIGIAPNTIVEFDRNHPGLHEEISQRLRGRHRFWKIHLAKEFEESLGNLHGTSEYDGDFRKVASLHFLPWVGRNYPQLDPRVLIVAESVYAWEQGDALVPGTMNDLRNDRLFGRCIVREHGLWAKFGIDRLSTSKIARGIERAVTGKRDLTPQEQERFWQSIAFHELVQEPLASRKQRPSNRQYEIGAKVFQRVADILKPDACIIVGTESRKVSAIAKEIGARVEWAEKIGNGYGKLLTVEGTPCKILSIRHVSSHFNWSKWHAFLQRNGGTAYR